MNLRILILVCALAPAVASAQSITTEIRAAYDDKGVLEYRRGSKIIRNELGQETERILLDGWPKYDRLTPYYRYSWEYDEQGRETVHNHHNQWPESDIVSLRDVTIHRDEKRIVETINQRGTDLSNHHRTIRELDDEGRTVRSTREYWRFGEWKVDRFVNQWGRVTSSSRNVTIRTDSTEIREHLIYNGDSWDTFTRSRIWWSKSATDSTHVWIHQRRDDGELVNSDSTRRHVVFGPTTDETTIERFEWSGGEWKLSYRTKTSRSHSSALEVSTTWGHEDGVWVPWSTISIHSGPSGTTLETRHEWEAGEWVPRWKYEWTYDGSGKPIEFENWSMIDDAWVLRYHETWTYESAFATDSEEMLGVPEESLHVSPNPVAGLATLHFDLGHSIPEEVVVFDVLGRRVQKNAWNPAMGRSGQVQVDMSRLSPGSYFVVLLGNGRSLSVPFVKL